MDHDNVKRKATTPPGEADISRGNKSKKPNPPDPGTQVACSAPAGASGRATDLTQKLVAMWVGGTPGHHPFMTQEVRDSVALRDAQEKCTEAEQVAQMFRNKINSAEDVITDLNKSLKAEERIKTELISKMKLTGDVGATIMEHIDYITDTLQRCQQHKDHLSDMYRNIIVKQREDYLRLKEHGKNMCNRITQLENTISDMEMNLENVNSMQADKSKQMEKAFEDELAKVREDCEKTRKQLEEIDREKKDMQSRLAAKESHSLDLEKKIVEYEDGLKNLQAQLATASANLESYVGVKSQLEKELADKNREILNISKDLELSTTKRNEQSVEISTIRNKNNELQEKINLEVDQRQTLSKSLLEASARNDELSRQAERLKNDKEEAVEEIKRKIENAERESQRILSEAKKENDELRSNQERIVKLHVEKYESCLAEMKMLEDRHQKELSRAGTSSSTALLNATTETNRLEEALESLKREKNDLHVELRRIEDLLKKHVDSEKRLRIKLEESQEEAAKYAVAVATAHAEKKREEDEKHEQICKVNELETELLKLKFNRSAATSNQMPDSGTSGDSERKIKERAKKPVVTSSYKKSILKRDSKQRRTRSSPPSPTAPAPVVPQDSTIFDKKITFHFDSSSEESPVKLPRSSAVSNFMDSDALFDEFVGTVKSLSQPMQSSPATSSRSQTGTKKFFKSRNSQSK